MKNNKANVGGIVYTKPTVVLLNESGIGVSEVAARTCYDSFAQSENKAVRDFPADIERGVLNSELNEIEDSELLDTLAWVHHHHSIIEHTTLSYLVKGTSRGVLQEHARHRLQSISVRSTRYTMSSVINRFVAAVIGAEYDEAKEMFIKMILPLDLFVVADEGYQRIEIAGMYEKLLYQYLLDPATFIENAVAKSSLPLDDGTADEILSQLEAGKKKRNVGDVFKHIVSDNWKVDMVITFNLRSLKNYFDLRDSGAAWFQIQWLAQAMKDATPEKYLSLIDKHTRDAKRG